MRIPINTTYKMFFRQLIELLRGMPPLDKLRNRELDLLSIIMYYNYLYKNLPEDVKWKIINNTQTRKEMQGVLGMKEDIFNNNLSIIRKTKLIDGDGKLVSFLQVYPDERFKIEFNFNIEPDAEI